MVKKFLFSITFVTNPDKMSYGSELKTVVIEEERRSIDEKVIEKKAEMK